MHRRHLRSTVTLLGFATAAASSLEARQLTTLAPAPEYEALGQADLEVEPGPSGEIRLALSGLGSSGRDGVAIRPGAAGFPGVRFAPAEAEGATLALYAFAEGAPRGRVLSARVGIRETDLAVSAWFAGEGGRQRVASCNRVPKLDSVNWEQKILRKGEPIVVAELPGAVTIGTFQPKTWGDPHESQEDRTGRGILLSLEFDSPVELRFPDGTSVEETCVAIASVEPLVVTGLERVEVRFTDVGSVILTVPEARDAQEPLRVELVPHTVDDVAAVHDARRHLDRLRRLQREGPVRIHAVDDGPSFFATLQGGRVVNYFVVGADGERLGPDQVTTRDGGGTSGEDDTVCWVCGKAEDGTTHCVQVECPVIVWAPGDEE